MTCDQATEFLPWLLNGTLDSAERDEVLRHLTTCESCREALAATREAWSTFDQHISSQDLVALAWGEEPAGPMGIDSALADMHVASCPQCAAELELARMSRRLEEEDNVALFPVVKQKPTSAGAPRTWRAAAIAAGLAAVVASSGWLHTAQQVNDPSRLAQAPESATLPAPQAPVGEGSSQKVAQLESQLRQLLGLQEENDKKLAATQAQIAQLEEERESWSRPQPGSFADLGSGSVVRSSEPGEDSQVKVKAGESSVLSFPARDGGKGRVEIMDSSGRIAWQASRLPVRQEYYTIILHPHSLAPGRYTVRITGVEEQWPFQVEP